MGHVAGGRGLPGVPSLGFVAGTTRSLQNLPSLSYFITRSIAYYIYYIYAMSFPANKPCIACPLFPFVNRVVLERRWTYKDSRKITLGLAERMHCSSKRKMANKVHSVYLMLPSSWVAKSWEFTPLKLLNSCQWGLARSKQMEWDEEVSMQLGNKFQKLTSVPLSAFQAKNPIGGLNVFANVFIL